MYKQITLEGLQPTEPSEPLEIGQIRVHLGVTFLICDLDLQKDLLLKKFTQVKIYTLEGQHMYWCYQDSSFIFDSTVLKGV